MQIIGEEEIQNKWAEIVKGSMYEQFTFRIAPLVIQLERWVEAQLLSGQGRRENTQRGDMFFSVTSGYGWETRKPFVGLELNGQLLAQVPAETARALAHNLLSAAEAAEQDAFLAEFVGQELGGTLEMAGQILNAYRVWRGSHEG